MWGTPEELKSRPGGNNASSMNFYWWNQRLYMYICTSPTNSPSSLWAKSRKMYNLKSVPSRPGSEQKKRLISFYSYEDTLFWGLAHCVMYVLYHSHLAIYWLEFLPKQNNSAVESILSFHTLWSTSRWKLFENFLCQQKQ